MMGRMTQWCLHLGLGALLATAAVPAVAQVVQEYEYGPDKIYQVRTGLGITTQIELSPHEEILDFSTGFSGGWDISRRENVFYLKPRNVDVDTNLLVRTAAHSYIFELKVVATNWRALDQAKASQKDRQLQIEDGWVYFLHGWTRVISDVYNVEIPSSGPVFDELSRIATSTLQPSS